MRWQRRTEEDEAHTAPPPGRFLLSRRNEGSAEASEESCFIFDTQVPTEIECLVDDLREGMRKYLTFSASPARSARYRIVNFLSLASAVLVP